jgi:hypothetical protein
MVKALHVPAGLFGVRVRPEPAAIRRIAAHTSGPTPARFPESARSVLSLIGNSTSVRSIANDVKPTSLEK